MPCCTDCAQGLACSGGACPINRPARRSAGFGHRGGFGASPASRYMVGRAATAASPHDAKPARTAAGLHDAPRGDRDAGALLGDVVVNNAAEAAAEAGKRRSVARGLAGLIPLPARTAAGLRDAGDVGEVSDTDAAGFDPSDPASMTESRWRTMAPTERRDWLNANVRDTEARNRMITSIATGVFDTVRDFVRTERETRLAEIREGNTTQRAQYAAQADVERERIRGEVERARIAAQTAQAEQARAEAAARATTDLTERARQEQLAADARTAAATASAAESAARERAAIAEAEAARQRSIAQASQPVSTGITSTQLAVGGVVLLGAAGLAALAMRQPPPPPMYGGQFPAPQYSGAGQ